ncbi:hypothetical protein WICMUC_000738 [Wickerhamomyces mucosus]|uniref:Histone-lysine N-methyltransferase SET5 n=1 Tax=Wickerhamomyces mucosus TaxID=1378264 RepID=A0A9P8PWI3_9ASCO|nr:hypothetical protein WICMUC_000738 [Wickerhamomyces mucosus]
MEIRNNDNVKDQISPNEIEILEFIKSFKNSNIDEFKKLTINKLFQSIKSLNNNWLISEKRFKSILKKYEYLIYPENFYYSSDIKSFIPSIDLNLPTNLYLKLNSKGKSLFTKTSIDSNSLIFQELEPLFFIPPLDHLNLMKLGKACIYCGNLLLITNDQSSLSSITQSKRKNLKKSNILNKLDCNSCQGIWCSINCKKKDILHQYLRHSTHHNNKIKSSQWLKFENFCLENNWQAGFAIGLIQSYIIFDDFPPKKKIIWDSLATVGQDIRYKAKFSNNNELKEEKTNEIWSNGFELFNSIFNQLENQFDDLSKYLQMIGTYNLNNFNGSIYSIQSNLNHSCIPNCKIEFIGNNLIEGIKLISKRDIMIDEELSINYLNNSNHLLVERQEELRIKYGFKCNCDRCKLEINPNGSIAKKVRKLSMNSDNNNIGNNNSERPDIIELTKDMKDFELNVDGIQPIRRKSVRFDT